MTCSCAGTVVTGCNKDLFSLNTCDVSLSPDLYPIYPYLPRYLYGYIFQFIYRWLTKIFQQHEVEGTCLNPTRSDPNATAASTFFAPCQGAAYTFADDNDADSSYQCQNGVIECCVGSDCPACPKQPSS